MKGSSLEETNENRGPLVTWVCEEHIHVLLWVI